MATTKYIVLHTMVDTYGQGDIIEGDIAGIDMKRLLDVGAIRKATAEEVKASDIAADPQAARGEQAPPAAVAERVEKGATVPPTDKGSK
jgi:hypothetical protein